MNEDRQCNHETMTQDLGYILLTYCRKCGQESLRLPATQSANQRLDYELTLANTIEAGAWTDKAGQKVQQ